MYVSSDADPLLELIPVHIAEAAENGVDSERLDPAEVRSVGGRGGFFWKVMHRCRGEVASSQADGWDTAGAKG